jgi:ACS family glucarate transporter-like MFS transporter
MAVPPDIPPSKPQRSGVPVYRHRVLGLLFLLAMITYLDRVCISVAGTTIQKELNFTAAQWGWVLGAFALSYALFEIPSGALGDRLGPRRVLTRIVTWWSAFTALTGFAAGFWSLVATRFCFGAGEAGAFPNAAATIQRWFPPRERAGAQGFVWMASRFGAAISPALVVPLQAAVGWRGTFVLFGTLGVGWAVFWFFWFRDRPSEKPGVSAEEIAHIGGGPGAGEPGGHGGAPWRQLFQKPNLWWIMLMYFLYCWTTFFYLSWLHTFLENARGFSKADLVRWSWLPFLFGGVANLLGGFASDRLVRRVGLKWGRRWIGLLGLLCAAVFTGATWCTQDKLWSVLFLAIGFGGADFMLPVAWAVCLDIGGRHAGAVSGAMNMAGQAASFLSSVAFGYIVTGTGNNWNAPLIPMTATALFAALCWLRIDASRPLDASVG